MAGRAARGEFALIARAFAPLAGEGAFGLTDDAALLRPPAGRDLVLTKDAIVAGVHFLPDDPPESVARKLLRVNLSDLAAKGAVPLGYLLATAWPKGTQAPWVMRFARALHADQARFGLSLLGGDTVSTPGPMTLSLTAIGTVPRGRMLRRAGARPGDGVYVTGTIGDGALGLDVALARLAVPPRDAGFLRRRYRAPEPRSLLGPRLAGLATAAIDISDGLVADLGHLATASGVMLAIDAAKVPLSPAAARAVAREPRCLDRVLGGGDDYEIAFTAPDTAARRLAAAAGATATPITRIGTVGAGTSGQGPAVTVLHHGRVLRLARRGWTHL